MELEKIVPLERVLKLLNTEKETYFDQFKSFDNEIFLDCGAFDGDMILRFINWCNNKYLKIYAIETEKDNYKNLIKNMQRNEIKNIEIINKRVWSSKQKLNFAKIGNSCPHIADNGDVIQTDTIDHIIKNTPVTFIKIDIEGAELDALKGAVNTICKNKPRLAICIFIIIFGMF